MMTENYLKNIFLFIFLFLLPIKIHAQNTFQVNNVKINNITNVSADISWQTPSPTQGKVEYWIPGETQTRHTPFSNLVNTHFFTLHQLVGNPYQLRIIALIDGKEISSEIFHFERSDTQFPEIKTFEIIEVSDTSVLIQWELEKNDTYYVKDVSAELKPVGEEVKTIQFGNEFSIFFPIKNLKPETEYEFYMTSQISWPDNIIRFSPKIKFKTKSNTIIKDINPVIIPLNGDTVTISGNGFGDRIGYILIGKEKPSQECFSNVELRIWSDHLIVFEIPSSFSKDCIPTDDFIHLLQTPYLERNFQLSFLTDVSLPIKIQKLPQQINKSQFSFHGCIFRDASNEDILQINDETQQSRILEINQSYREIWSRKAKCDEVQFHLDHKTPILTLKKWLIENTIKEIFSCPVGTTHDFDTILMKNTFGPESEVATYLNNIFFLYMDIWDRAARCDELNFHLQHSTSLNVLKQWLSNNESSFAPGALSGPLIESVEYQNQKYFTNFISSFEIPFDAPFIIYGNAPANSLVILDANTGEKIFNLISEQSGKWNYSFHQSFKPGRYILKASVLGPDLVKTHASEIIQFEIQPSNKKPANESFFLLISHSTTILIIVFLILCILLGGYLIYHRLQSSVKKLFNR